MADELQEETESTQAESNGLAWFMMGALIGAAVAILYAPKSGRDARQYLLDKGKETLDDSKEMFDRGRQLVDDAADLFERGRKLVKG